MTRPLCRVLIVGCGIIGLPTAIGLCQNSHEVIIFKRMSERLNPSIPIPKEFSTPLCLRPQVGGGIQLPRNATKCLRRLSVLEPVREKAIHLGPRICALTAVKFYQL